MRTLLLASAVMMLVVGRAMGANSVQMRLEVNGKNNGASCDNRIAFTPGSEADGQFVTAAGGDVTWGVRLYASGDYLDGSTKPIHGVANFVFDLELYRGTYPGGTLATDAVFHSTVNEKPDCADDREKIIEPTGSMMTAAAFAYAFNLGGNGPGRVFDYWQAIPAEGRKGGGPRMNVHCYPKAPPSSGKLFGMGAGYSSWNRTDADLFTTAGVGMVGAAPIGDPACGGLGHGPVCEGQISGLTPGTYTLRLIPGGGINHAGEGVNVLNDLSKANRFARAADTANQEDTITFIVPLRCPPPPTLAWFSMKTCANVELSIQLDQDALSRTTECRKDGVQKVVVRFREAVSAIYRPGQVQVTGGTLAVGPGGDSLSPDGLYLTIPLTGSADGFCYKIDISQCFSAGATVTNTVCRVGTLYCDVNDDGTVDLGDMLITKGRINYTVDPTYCRYDVNCDGAIDLGDMLIVKSRIGGGLTACP
jgi:hypothetical protein